MIGARIGFLALIDPGYSGRQSALRAAGPQAGRIEDLWWVLFWVSVVVFVLVLSALAIALAKGRRDRSWKVMLTPPPESERRMIGVVGGATAVTALVLLGLLVVSVSTGRAISPLAAPKDALLVNVTGHQWWWEFEYQNADPSRIAQSPNELHIPVGRPVRIQTRSADVIHSFWVPNLHGKLDLIPGRVGDTWIQADRPGVYRGQCAEFCGYQHAHMSFLVVAEPEERFQAWLAQQRQSAPQPATALAQRGQQLFLSLPCSMCHAVQGTQAGSRLGPDLTHLASRRTLAAGTLVNRRGQLGGWIMDPQHLKPGTLMPRTNLSSEDLNALLAYLETLR